MVSYGDDDDILFQYFTFKLLILPLEKAHLAVFSTLQWHVIKLLFDRVETLG